VAVWGKAFVRDKITIVIEIQYFLIAFIILSILPSFHGIVAGEFNLDGLGQ
jgi:hypothetical protein